MLRPLRKLVRRNEFLRSKLRRLYRFSAYHLAKGLTKLRKGDNGLRYVEPNEITHTVSRFDDTWKGNAVWHFGTVSGGDWDRDGYVVRERSQIYPILKQRVLDGLEYEVIPEFQEHLQEIKSGGFIDGCTTPEQYVQRWQHIEAVYQAIKSQGYKTQAELGSDNILDEVRCILPASPWPSATAPPPPPNAPPNWPAPLAGPSASI
jgi:hypothetical protein